MTWFAHTFDQLVGNIEKAVLGKQHVTRLALTCLLSEGHMLLEDFPGTGKTQLARALSATVQGTHSRIQFTPDLLPSDVTGVTIYEPTKQTFEFHPGPIFATIVLADEINRASPKTQSALLEVMEEGRVTIDGKPHSVGEPFMVIATQNPIEQAGTYRLPEAQLDRFLMKASVGYPDHEATIAVLADAKTRDRAKTLSPLIASNVIVEMSQARRRGARRPRHPRLRQPHRRGVAPPPVAQARAVGARLPGLRALRQDVGREPGPHLRRPRRHQAACRAGALATACCSTPRPSSPGRTVAARHRPDPRRHRPAGRARLRLKRTPTTPTSTDARVKDSE